MTTIRTTQELLKSNDRLDPAELIPGQLVDAVFFHDPDNPCRYFALCDHEAIGTTDHPVLPPVPTCERCAARFGLTITPFSTAPRDGGS